MTEFFVGSFMHDLTTDVQHAANEWFRIEQSDMCNWITEQAGDRWALNTMENKVIFGGTGQDDLEMLFIDLYVVYDSDHHAMLHKLRWE